MGNTWSNHGDGNVCDHGDSLLDFVGAFTEFFADNPNPTPFEGDDGSRGWHGEAENFRFKPDKNGDGLPDGWRFYDGKTKHAGECVML